MREDNQMLTIMHVSQLLGLVTGFGGFIVPLILWLTQKDNVVGADAHGKLILNFQISLFIYGLVCVPLFFIFGLGFIGLLILWIISLIFPIINAIKVSNREIPTYPFTIEIIK